MFRITGFRDSAEPDKHSPALACGIQTGEQRQLGRGLVVRLPAAVSA